MYKVVSICEGFKLKKGSIKVLLVYNFINFVCDVLEKYLKEYFLCFIFRIGY